jgi:DNA-binding beta-propeller fold protein YncE
MKLAFALATMLGMTLAHAQSQELVKLWETEARLKVPESVYYDAKRNLLYVSNIDGRPWDDDGHGSIAKLSPDGKIVAAEWITGMSAPKGMTLEDSLLYVADMTNVVVIDVDSARIVKRIAIAGAQGLNDVTLASDGTVYVSDSLAKKVFALNGDAAALYLDGLTAPNGLTYDQGALYVLDGDSLYRVGPGRTLERIAGGIPGTLDGLESLGGREFLLSTWQGTLHYVHADGSYTTLLDTRAEKISAADIGYDRIKRIVYVPTFFRNTVAAYQLRR